jgi:hypothetical protein
MASTARSLWTLGYCSNIHPGTDVAGICDNLKNVSADVAARRTTKSRLGVGLWIPNDACVALRRHGMPPLVKAIEKHRLLAYTINGFPYDDFHQERVKHSVYQPTWWSDARVIYTRDLAKILVELLPKDATIGTISTLPIGWPRQVDEDASENGQTVLRDVNEEELLHAGTNFRRLAEDLRMLENRTGKRIIVAIEPEPGCLIERSEQLVDFFQTHLPDPTHRRYIGVCHDVCHSAVMMEDQGAVLRQYASAGITLAKVQISSAIVADWQNIEASDHAVVLDQLRTFAEDRYLHQTGRRTASGSFKLAEDLPDLLNATTETPITDKQWVVHFHVPVFLEEIGYLKTTRPQIIEVLDVIEALTKPPAKASANAKPALEFTGHLEVETYAWSVLPDEMRAGGLAADIASELNWVSSLLT